MSSNNGPNNLAGGTIDYCAPNQVPIALPNVANTSNWCVTPNVDLTSIFMSQCCGTNAVNYAVGCTWCHFPDSYLQNSSYLNSSYYQGAPKSEITLTDDFTTCLWRAIQGQNYSVPIDDPSQLVVHCNAPTLQQAVGAASQGVSGRRVASWELGALVVCMVAGAAGWNVL